MYAANVALWGRSRFKSNLPREKNVLTCLWTAGSVTLGLQEKLLLTVDPNLQVHFLPLCAPV